jgi:hypothetical protein
MTGVCLARLRFKIVVCAKRQALIVVCARCSKYYE